MRVFVYFVRVCVASGKRNARIVKNPPPLRGGVGVREQLLTAHYYYGVSCVWGRMVARVYWNTQSDYALFVQYYVTKYEYFNER